MALAANALTTAAAAADELGITDAAKMAPVERLINAASELIARFCNRELHYRASIAERVAGFGGELLFLSHTPIVSVASVMLDGQTVDAGLYSVGHGPAGTLYCESGWVWTAAYASGVVAPSLVAGTEAKRYLVTYSAGYVTPEQARLTPTLTRTLPYDLEQACLYTAVHMHRLRGKFKAAVVETTESSDDVWEGMGIPKAVRAFLEPYRRVS